LNYTTNPYSAIFWMAAFVPAASPWSYPNRRRFPPPQNTRKPDTHPACAFTYGKNLLLRRQKSCVAVCLRHLP
jgi:hypothetical protein